MRGRTWILLIIEALLFIGVFLVYHKDNQVQESIYVQNLIAAQDSLSIYKMKNDELLYEKSLYIQNEKDLKRIVNISKNELNDLKKKVGELQSLVQIQSHIKIDTVHSVKDSIIYIDNGFQHNFEYNDKWLSMKGNSWVNEDSTGVSIFDININTPLKIGMSKDHKFFVSSPNPYLVISDVDGAILEDAYKETKKSKWSHGLSIGFGIQYGIINKEIDIGPQFGYYIQYEF